MAKLVVQLPHRGNARCEQEPSGFQALEVEHGGHVRDLEVLGLGLVLFGIPAASLGVVFDVVLEVPAVTACCLHKSHFLVPLSYLRLTLRLAPPFVITTPGISAPFSTAAL